MDRRQLVLGLAGMGGLAASTPAPAQLLNSKPRLTTASVMVRKSFTALSAAEIAALKTGIAAMKARPITDPTSWLFQAAIHGTLTGSNPAWNQCQHGTDHFFSWHRMYLYWFERILRKASGSSTLTLPYWDWLTDATLPAPFRDTTAGNPLFNPRGSGINGGSPLPASSVQVGGPMSAVDFFAFQGSFEGTPHGAVHVSVGGDMGSVPTAAKDPIFWLHHCMIDRTWPRWLAQGGGRANPVAAAWKNASFSFFDENGAPVSQKASDVLNTRTQLGYVYDRDLLKWINIVRYLPRLRIPPEILERLRALPQRPPVPPEPPGPWRLGPDAQELRIQLAVDQAKTKVAKPPKELGQLPPLLLLSDIAVEGPPIGFYEVYLNLGPNETANTKLPSYAGNLEFFAFTANTGAAGAHAGHGPQGKALALDLTDTLQRLRTAKRFDGKSVELRLVRRGADTGTAADARPGTVTIGGARVFQ